MQNKTAVVMSKNKDIYEDCDAYNSLHQWPIDEYNTILRNINDALHEGCEENAKAIISKNVLVTSYSF